MRAAAVGLMAWLAGMAFLPGPLVERMLLAGPLIVVPSLLSVLPTRAIASRLTTVDLAPWPALAAALLLLPTFAVPAGPVAAALCLPWLLICGSTALAGVRHGLTNLPEVLHPRNSAQLATDAALVYLLVGGSFLFAHRAGVDVLSFSPLIVLLTAVHYHFVGFGLLAVTATLAAGQRRVGVVAALALVAGMPVTAVGFTLGAPQINWLGSVLVVVGGMCAALLLLQAAVRGSSGVQRVLPFAASIALALGVPLGLAWATSMLLGDVPVDIETMVRTHGALNGVGLLLATFHAVGRRA
jgi:hypothetical protein